MCTVDGASKGRRAKTRRRKGVAKIPKSEFSDFGIVFRGNRRSGCRPEIGRVLSRSPSEPKPILANLDPQIPDPAFCRRAPPKQDTATSGDAAPRGCMPSFKFRAAEIPNMIFRRSGFPRFLRSNRSAGSAPYVGPQLRGSRRSGLSFPARGPPQIRRRAPRVPRYHISSGFLDFRRSGFARSRESLGAPEFGYRAVRIRAPGGSEVDGHRIGPAIPQIRRFRALACPIRVGPCLRSFRRVAGPHLAPGPKMAPLGLGPPLRRGSREMSVALEKTGPRLPLASFTKGPKPGTGVKTFVASESTTRWFRCPGPGRFHRAPVEASYLSVPD